MKHLFSLAAKTGEFTKLMALPVVGLGAIAAAGAAVVYAAPAVGRVAADLFEARDTAVWAFRYHSVAIAQSVAGAAVMGTAGMALIQSVREARARMTGSRRATPQ